MDKLQPVKISERIRRDMEVFEATEGWEHLSRAQKDFIRDSLLVSEKAKLGAREATALANDPILRALGKLYDSDTVPFETYNKLVKAHLKHIYKNEPAKEHVDMYYCNISVFVLEKLDWLLKESALPTGAFGELPSEFPGKDFFSGVEYDFTDSAKIKRAFKDEFPYICHVHRGDENSIHTFVVFGRKGNDFVLWEKAARGESYRRSTLKKQLREYGHLFQDWVVRPMERSKELES